jgi:hypothetical protein
MKRTVNGLAALGRLSDRLLPFALLSAAVPLLLLAGFGLYGLFRYGYWLAFLIALLVSTVLVTGGLLIARRRLAAKVAPTVEQAAQKAPKIPDYWLERDRQIHRQMLPELLELLKANPQWPQLPDNGLLVIRRVAESYRSGAKRAEWAFTAPELLAIVEQVSRRYRRVLKTHVPGVDHLRLSTLMTVNEQLDRFGPWATKAFNTYRVLRMVTPDGLVAEALSQLRGEVFHGLSDELQGRLKYLLMLEVLRAAIDLYGGHFRFDDEQIKLSDAARQDTQRMAAPVEPIRIGFIGQVGAGKSSLINALTGSLRAEVSALPATEGVQVYECRIDGTTAIHLVDLPGLNGEPKTEKLLFEQVQDCDLLLWVLKANQPARALDQSLRRRLNAWFAQPRNTDHRPPTVIGVLSQIDRLAADPQAPVIGEALAFNRELLGVEQIVPVALEPAQVNLDTLRRVVSEQFAVAANVQLNRRRREAGEFSMSREAQRLQQAAKGVLSLWRE